MIKRLYLALMATAALAVFTSTVPAKDRTLASVHADVKERFHTVQHLTAQDLKTLDPADLVIFDVREKGDGGNAERVCLARLIHQPVEIQPRHAG